MTRPLVIDLFAGAGGLSKGLEMAGFKVTVANEIHPDAAATYTFNHPDTVMIHGDASKLSGSEILTRAGLLPGELDLLVGGPPCQGFSTAGLKQYGDPRNTLVAEFIRLLRELSPRYFLLENVPGMKTMYRGRFFGRVLALLDKTGYNYRYAILRAHDFGVPQLRKRLFIAGSKNGKAPHFPRPTHYVAPTGYINKTLPVKVTRKRDKCPTVVDAISDLPEIKPGQTITEYDKPPENDFQREMRRGAVRLYNHVATRHKRRTIELFSRFPEGGTQRDLPLDPETGKRPYKKNIQRWHRNKLSRAITSEPTDFIHYGQNRIPTIRELARLQTFPDTYVFKGQRTAGNVNRRFVYCAQSQQVGGVVPPFLARAIGRTLIEQISQ